MALQEKQLLQMMQSLPATINTLRTRMNQSMKVERWEQVILDATSLIAFYPPKSMEMQNILDLKMKACEKLGYKCFKEGEYATAAMYFRFILEAQQPSRDHGRMHFMLGKIEMKIAKKQRGIEKKEHLEKAMIQFMKALDFDDSNVEYMNNYQQTASEARKYSKIERILNFCRK